MGRPCKRWRLSRLPIICSASGKSMLQPAHLDEAPSTGSRRRASDSGRIGHRPVLAKQHAGQATHSAVRVEPSPIGPACLTTAVTMGPRPVGALERMVSTRRRPPGAKRRSVSGRDHTCVRHGAIGLGVCAPERCQPPVRPPGRRVDRATALGTTVNAGVGAYGRARPNGVSVAGRRSSDANARRAAIRPPAGADASASD
jgi:hypothetical protein